MTLIRWFTLLLIVTLFSGCASRPADTGPADHSLNQQALQQFTHWHISGRFAFKNSEEKFSANMHWRQQQQDYRFRLTSFVGSTLMDMQGQSGEVSLEIDDHHYTDNNASALLYRITGWQIPVEKLAVWVKGQVPAAQGSQYNAQGLVSEFTPRCAQCGDWQVNYSDYKQQLGLWLPHSIKLVNLNSPDHQIRIRINQWKTS